MSRLIAGCLLPIACAVSSSHDVLINLTGTESLWTISKYLASMSLVYSWAPSRVYGNATSPNVTMANWARRAKLRTARYPAGEASSWNWEDPSGTMGKSTLDPHFKESDRAPPEDWMSLDEYLDLCEAAELTPLIGVNYNCHGQYFVPQNESIARAVRQVQHVLSRGFRGGLWYIGNEDGAQNHAAEIAAHARAMKAIDPSIKVFWNDNDQSPERLKRFLSEAGRAVDGAEFHGKWPYGGKPKLPPGTYAEWLKEVPLIERKSGETWRSKIEGLRQAAKEAGRPDLLLANNEFGLGKPDHLVGFNRFTKSMVAVEFALEMYVAGYDVAAFWDNSDGGHLDHDDQMLLATAEGYRFNPMHFGFEMLAESAGMQMLKMRTTFTNHNVKVQRVHGFAASARVEQKGNGGHFQELRIFLMNKMQTSQSVQIELLPGSAPLKHAYSMVDTPDHWGSRTTTDVTCSEGVIGDNKRLFCNVELPAVSFTMLSDGIATATNLPAESVVV